MEVNLDNFIIPTFREIAQEVINCSVDRVIKKGGRASTKSQETSIEIVVGCMVYKQSAVAVIRYQNKVEQRLVDTFRFTMKLLNVEKYWKLRKSPFEYVLLDENGRETDVSIRFLGADQPENIKSYNARGSSIFRYIWVEEATNFDSEKQLNNLLNTLIRGKGKHCVIFTYNPPQRSSNWINKMYDVPVGKILGHNSNSYREEFKFDINGEEKTAIQVIHHSTYKDVIDAGHYDWLGTEWIAEAEKAKVENKKYYDWCYMGEVIGTDANVFNNIKEWDGNIDKINTSELFRGFDWSNGGPDPNALVVWAYDRKNRNIYAIDEMYGHKMSIDEIASGIRALNKHNFPIYADSAVPALNQQLINKGLNVVGVKKPPDSIRAGIKWLQSINGIYICKYRTPNIYREFSQYENEVDKEGNITSKLPDKDNHTIDATRYAFYPEIIYD